MEFRNIIISNPARLSIRHGQLCISQEQEVTFPTEDICTLMLESQQISVSAAALETLASSGVTVFLLKDGYHMVQYSVYARICNGTDAVETHKLRLKAALPPKGAVRMIVVTEKQFNNIEILVGSPNFYDKPQQEEQLMEF